MRIIILKDLESLGKKYEVKDVKDGYARNFLIPKGYARLATEKALKELEILRSAEEKVAGESLEKIQKVAASMEGREILISVKVGKEGQLFESITSKKICDKLKELGFNIKKDQVELSQPIKDLGEFPVKVKFEHNLEVEITIVVVEGK